MVEGVTLRNTITGEYIVIDARSTYDYVLSYASWGSAPGSHEMRRFTGQVGQSIASTLLDERSVDIVGWVIADDCETMAARKQVLNRFINPQEPIDMTYGNYTLRFYPDSSVVYSQEEPDNNDVICKFEIVGTAPDPTFASSAENRVDAAGNISMFHFPLVIPNEPDPPGGFVFGYRRPSLITKVVNRGVIPTGIRVTFTANGAVENPYIVLIETQEQFKINKSLKAGDVVEVSTVVGSKYVRGTVDNETTNYFKYRDIDSAWLQLRVGENNLRYGADSGTEQLDVAIYYYDRFLEVEGC